MTGKDIRGLFDEEIIKSGGVDYQRGKAACEIFAEDMAANLTGDTNEIEGMQFFKNEYSARRKKGTF